MTLLGGNLCISHRIVVDIIDLFAAPATVLHPLYSSIRSTLMDLKQPERDWLGRPYSHGHTDGLDRSTHPLTECPHTCSPLLTNEDHLENHYVSVLDGQSHGQARSSASVLHTMDHRTTTTIQTHRP